MKISSSSQQQIGSSYSNHASKDNKVKDKNSPLGENTKKNKLVEQLMKQKQNLVESKSELVERTLKCGENPSSIKEKLESIDSQIKEIEGQISKMQIEDQREALGMDEKGKKIKEAKEGSTGYSSNGTKAEDAEKQMNSLLNISGNLARTKILSSQKKSMEGETGVLECEIKIDISRGLNPIAKKERVSHIKDRMQNITENIEDNLNTINNEVKNINEGSTSSEITHKNKESKNSSNTGSEDKLSSEQQQIIEKIQCYNNNLPENTKQVGEKIDATA